MPDDKLAAKLKLSQQLVMTPQLQMAIKLLATPSLQLPALIDAWRAEHPGCTEELAPGEADPAQVVDDDDRPPFELLEASPLAPDPRADVWIFGNPPEVRANGRGFPRLKACGTGEALIAARWLVRALRQRARTFEAVVRAVVEAQPAIAITRDGKGLAPIKLRGVAEAIGMHESTITRAASACRFQNLHGVFGFATTRRGLAIEPLG